LEVDLFIETITGSIEHFVASVHNDVLHFM